MKTSVILSLSALSAVAVSQATLYGQCGGQGWTGPTTCVSGATCVSYNEWYSQCIAGGDSDETEPEPEPSAEPSAPQVSSAESTAAPTAVEEDDDCSPAVTDPPAAPSTVDEAPAPTFVTEAPSSTSEAAAVTATSSEEDEAEPTTEAPVSEPATTLATATKPATTVIAAPSGVTKTLPQAAGTVETDAAIPVSGEFDGGMKLYDRNPKVCKDQSETGEKDAMFILEDGATLSNVIIGPGQAEGVHCKGSCTLINVWHSDVCEDAITLKQKSGTSNIIGGGAFHASDKVVQFNGRGTVSIKDFYVEDYGKLVRNCGNCKDNGGPRDIIIENVVAVDGGVLCGINTNYGDTCTVAGSCQNAGKSCDRYTGNSSGDEPKKIGSGPDGEFCTVTGLTETC
ncbi:pectate lyase [Colletotrichum truncatum]|uniref:Pectate lyase n=1 Tax=Colletotrichum truncatum TaxID=5467 RepID=A0ACC3ZDQ1_COLTU|nr:pectate lyase [Colletotrichum truncatum]KAF6794830.1 pectate lyase [Colletotrichum truncatum]